MNSWVQRDLPMASGKHSDFPKALLVYLFFCFSFVFILFFFLMLPFSSSFDGAITVKKKISHKISGLLE